jgi:hypothetical protein
MYHPHRPLGWFRWFGNVPAFATLRAAFWLRKQTADAGETGLHCPPGATGILKVVGSATVCVFRRGQSFLVLVLLERSRTRAQVWDRLRAPISFPSARARRQTGPAAAA